MKPMRDLGPCTQQPGKAVKVRLSCTTMKPNNCTDPDSTRAALVMPIKMIVVHHCSLSTKGLDVPNPIPDSALTGSNLSKMFEERNLAEPLGLGTSGCRPYHALIRVDGQVDQCISLMRRGAHALAYNCNTLAVATAGEHGLTDAQRGALIGVLSDWLQYTEGVSVVGHTSLADATKFGHPVCPHPTTDVGALTVQALSLTKASCGINQEERAAAMTVRGWII